MEEVHNLDAMSVDELIEFTMETKNKDLMAYGARKILAMHARLKGEIERALKHEAKCEEIYAKLPAELKW